MSHRMSSKRLFKEMEKVLLVTLLCLAAIAIVIVVFGNAAYDGAGAAVMAH